MTNPPEFHPVNLLDRNFPWLCIPPLYMYPKWLCLRLSKEKSIFLFSGLHSPFYECELQWIFWTVKDEIKKQFFDPFMSLLSCSKLYSPWRLIPLYCSMLWNILILCRCSFSKVNRVHFSNLTEMLCILHCRCSLPLRLFSWSWMDAFKINLVRTISKVAEGISFPTDVLISCIN